MIRFHVCVLLLRLTPLAPLAALAHSDLVVYQLFNEEKILMPYTFGLTNVVPAPWLATAGYINLWTPLATDFNLISPVQTLEGKYSWQNANSHQKRFGVEYFC